MTLKLDVNGDFRNDLYAKIFQREVDHPALGKVYLCGVNGLALVLSLDADANYDTCELNITNKHYNSITPRTTLDLTIDLDIESASYLAACLNEYVTHAKRKHLKKDLEE